MSPSGADARDRDRAADARARQEAQTHFERPLVLEAGAGTGKTTVLVARVVAWCVGPGWEQAVRETAAKTPPHARSLAGRVLSGVVAITFTEAAAAEMESRVGQALRGLARGELPLGVAAHALPALAEASRRAAALLASLDRLVMRTIHGFCSRLLAAHALEAGIHPRFRVDGRGLERAGAVREAVEERLRTALEEGLDADLLVLAEHGKGPAELAEAVEALLEKGVSALDLAADPLDSGALEALAGRLRQALDALADAGLARLADGSRVSREATGWLESLRERLHARPPGDVAQWAELAQEVREEWPRPRKRVEAWSRSDLGERDRSCLADSAPALARAAAAAVPLLDHLGRFDPRLLGAALRVLHGLLDRAEAALRARGAESYAQLLRDARDLLADPVVRARVRRGIDQLLVDEFQDTDRLQCEIVAALSLDASPAGRPGLFLVGDPKQSIYGWRDADLRAYEDFVERVCAAGGERHRLCVNYRSDPAILAEVCRALEPVMTAEHGVQPAFEPLHPGVATTPGAAEPFAAVEYWITCERDARTGAFKRPLAHRAAEIEAQALAADLVRLQGFGVAWAEVGILLRATTDLDVYVDALREAGVPYVVDRDRSYARRREVLDAAALVRAVLDPNDQLALVATLRSAWVGVPDAAWRRLWERAFPARVRDALGGSAQALARATAVGAEVARLLPEDAVPGLARIPGWEHNLAHALRVLAVLRHSFLTDAPDRFVERLRTLSLLEAVEAARFPGPYRVANLERFFRELRAALEERNGDWSAVVRTLREGASDEGDVDEGRPREASGDAVQILTIHQAKGLDFGHVYLLQTHKGSGGGVGPSIRAETLDGQLDVQLFGAPSPGFDRVAAHRERVEQAERVRTLYVALTRARRRLVVAGSRSAEAGTHAEILARSRGPAAARAEQRLHESPAWVDDDGVRWVALVAPAQAPPAARRAPGVRLPPLARVEEDAHRLRLLRGEALARRARPRGGAASGKAHEQLRELLAAASEGPELGGWGDGALVATAVGSAVHALLERFDWCAEENAELARQRERFSADLERRVPPALLPDSLARGARLLDVLVEGPLWPRLRAIAPHVVARELPVLLPTEGAAEEPLEYLSGAIDLVYRDGEHGHFVVADFKSDAVSTEREIAARVRAYAPQAMNYVRALREALSLDAPPRFEFWFLEAGRIQPMAG